MLDKMRLKAKSWKVVCWWRRAIHAVH